MLQLAELGKDVVVDRFQFSVLISQRGSVHSSHRSTRDPVYPYSSIGLSGPPGHRWAAPRILITASLLSSIWGTSCLLVLGFSRSSIALLLPLCVTSTKSGAQVSS